MGRGGWPGAGGGWWEGEEDGLLPGRRCVLREPNELCEGVGEGVGRGNAARGTDCARLGPFRQWPDLRS